MIERNNQEVREEQEQDNVEERDYEIVLIKNQNRIMSLWNEIYQ